MLYDTRTLQPRAAFSPSRKAISTASSSAATAASCWSPAAALPKKGLAVAFDVKTGDRLFEVGNEYDVALAADISPDRTLGRPWRTGKVVRVYRTDDGELAYEARKHTDWITAVRFSPDGVLARLRRSQRRPAGLGSRNRARVLRPPRPLRPDHKR